MPRFLSRRAFLKQTAASGAQLAGLAAWCRLSPAAEPAGSSTPFLVTDIEGSPRERGRRYGETFRDAVNAFLEKEIYGAFIAKPSPKDELLRYAGDCGKVVARYTPEIDDELTGLAEGAEIERDEALLITLHEELYHKGALPKVPHCTAVAVGPPATSGGRTYVGQTWDWMQSVFGLSSVCRWKRSEGPSLLAYGYPGLWAGAGLNSDGLALCWTSAALGDQALGARVGVPAYVLLTHFLYQRSLDDVVTEARRATNAGWFTFVLGDDRGRLLNIEGSPQGIETEWHEGRLTRIGYGSRKMTGTPAGAEVPLHARCRKMNDLLAGASGRIDRETLQGFFADPALGICVGKSTIDMMVYDTTARAAYVSRGPDYGVAWQKVTFDGAG